MARRPEPPRGASALRAQRAIARSSIRKGRGRILASLERLEQRLALTAEPNGPEFLVNGNPGFQQRGWDETARAVALDADGDFVVTWSSYGQDGSGYGVYARRFNQAGEPQGDEFRVNTTTFENQLFSSVAMDDEGDFVVVWASFGQDGDGYGVYFRRFNAAGEPQGGEVLVNSTTSGDQTQPSIAMNSSGDFVIVWQDFAAGSPQIRAQRYAAGGAKIGGEVIVGSSDAGATTSPSAAMDDAGGFIVAWTGAAVGGSSDVFVRRFGSTGLPLSDAVAANVAKTGMQTSAVVAADEAGNFVVAWASEDQDGSGWGIFARRFAADGTPLDGADIPVNSHTQNSQQGPSIARAPNGTFVITWSSAQQDASGWGVYGQLFNADGSRSGVEFRVNSTTAENQRYASVEMDDDGDFVVIWSSYNQAAANSAYDIYAQRYAPNKPPVANPGGPYVILEGQGLQLDGSASFDPDGDPLSYVWDVDGDLDFDDGVTGPTPSLSLAQLLAIHPSLGDGPSPTLMVRLRLDDGKGHIVTSEGVSLTVQNVAPTIAVAGPPSVGEGEPYQLTLGAVTDPGPDTVTQWIVDWGDGNVESFSSAGVKAHQYTSLGTKHIRVHLVDEDGTHNDAGTHVVDVRDTPPSIALSGPAQVNEGQTYTLTLGEITDPGGVTVTQWIVRWGDGSVEQFASGGDVTHVYVDDLGPIVIRVDLVDATGTHLNAGTHAVTVNNVRPTIVLSGFSSVDEGSLYNLLLGQITDPGADTVTQWRVNWGDGIIETFNSGGPKSHVYANGPLTAVIRVDLVDEDGLHTGAGVKLVQVNNVLPTVSVSGADALDEGQTYTLTIGNVFDPGADVVSAFIVDWGDGQVETFTTPGAKTHRYLKSNPNTLIRVDIQDNDGTHTARAMKTINVRDVAPTIALTGPATRAEGAPYPLLLGAITDPGDDVVTQWIVDWGDGHIEIFNSGGVKVHNYADDAEEIIIRVSLVDGEGTHPDAGTKVITITNVAPIIALDGNSTAIEGAPYHLTLGAVTDPGADTVTQYIVDWGDGRKETFVTPGVKTHVYEDGPSNHTIRVDLVDEDGVHANAGIKLIGVLNVPPTVALSGNDTADEGSLYTLSIGNVVDPGRDTITEVRVDWGDGNVEVFPAVGSKTHRYIDDGDFTIRVHLLDEDGLHEDAGTKLVSVKNVPPTAALSGKGQIAERDFFVLNIGAVTDPGLDTVMEFHVDWGDGQVDILQVGGQAVHQYIDDGQYIIRVHVLDEDGLHADSGTHLLDVHNVAPTINLAGTGSLPEGSPYQLVLGAVMDPGADTVAEYHVDWGDGTVEVFTTDGEKSHVYADDGPFTIRVHLKDEDGLHTDAGTKLVTVQNVPPTATLVGDELVVRGQPWELSANDIVDPGTDTIAGARVDWGDGEISTPEGTGPWSHVFRQSTGRHTVRVWLIDEDGQHLVGSRMVRVLLEGDVDASGTVGLADFNILKGNFGLPGTRQDGDTNGDGQVDLSDFNLLKTNFGQNEQAPALPGDANGDQVVNLADFNILKAEFGTANPSPADFNRDQVVNLADFNILKENFGRMATAAGAAAIAHERRDSVTLAAFDQFLEELEAQLLLDAEALARDQL